jgi:hypothetical protein
MAERQVEVFGQSPVASTEFSTMNFLGHYEQKCAKRRVSDTLEARPWRWWLEADALLWVEDPGPAKPDIHGLGECRRPTLTPVPIQCRTPLKGAICLTLAVTTPIIEAANEVQGADALR